MLKKIKSIVYNAYFINKSGGHFILEETDRGASCKAAHVEAKNDYLIYKFDQEVSRDGSSIRYLFPFYDPGKANAMCDYIIFYENTAGKIFAVICNLKSNNVGNNKDQIDAGIIFSQFIFDTAKRVFPETFLNAKLNFVKVLFSSRELYSKSNGNKIINLISSDQITERLVLENKCRF